MNFHFGVVAIFLILDVISAQSTGNGSSKKKRTLSKDQFNLDVATNSSINHRSTQNSFLQPSNNNQNRSSFLSNGFASQTSDTVFPADDYVSFLKNNNSTWSVLSFNTLNTIAFTDSFLKANVSSKWSVCKILIILSVVVAGGYM